MPAKRPTRWRRGCANGARELFADIHPAHEASMNVARHLGLKPGEEILESGEIRWSE